MPEGDRVVIAPDAIGVLLAALRTRGYRVLGPTVVDGAIVYAELESADELPIGWTDRQDGGTYRLERRDDDARFGYAVGPHSWKQFLFPPRIRLWRARRERRRRARGRGGAARRRRRSRSSACARASSTRSRSRTACSSAGASSTATTPHAARARSSSPSTASSPAARASASRWAPARAPRPGYDLALTEILDGEHRLLVEAGRERGAEVLARAAGARRRRGDVDAADARGRRCGASGWAGEMEAGDLRDLLADNLEHPRWDDVAERCLTCGNCTMVLPDVLLLERRGRRPISPATRPSAGAAGTRASRSTTRTSTAAASGRSGRSRYRQWMTHKLGTWHDQFGTSGCVGCGRCITWCPVGIDITEEVAAIREGGDGQARLKTVLADVPFFAGLTAGELELLAGCARERRTSATATSLFREGEPADTFYVVRARHASRSRHSRPTRGAGDDRDDRRRRGDRLVVALPAVPLALRRACAVTACARRRSTASACAASASTIRRSATT